MALRFGPAALLLMLMSSDARFALGFVLCRLAGVLSLFAAHPLLAPFFQFCILCLDSLFDLAQSHDPVLASVVSTVSIPVPLHFAGLPSPWHHFRLRFIVGRSCSRGCFAACLFVACFLCDGLHETRHTIDDSHLAYSLLCGVLQAPSISIEPRFART